MPKGEPPAIKRRNHKWAMCAVKGGHCVVCQKRVTDANFEAFHFDHKVRLNRPNDNTQRWTGQARDFPPFTEKWYAWAETVELVCEPCHQERHRQEHRRPCLLKLMEFQEVQARLESHKPTFLGDAVQQELF